MFLSFYLHSFDPYFLPYIYSLLFCSLTTLLFYITICFLYNYTHHTYIHKYINTYIPIFVPSYYSFFRLILFMFYHLPFYIPHYIVLCFYYFDFLSYYPFVLYPKKFILFYLKGLRRESNPGHPHPKRVFYHLTTKPSCYHVFIFLFTLLRSLFSTLYLFSTILFSNYSAFLYNYMLFI